MMHTLVGAQAFRKGIDLYFERHDGHAVTTDDLVQRDARMRAVSTSRSSGVWYEQAGTPRLDVRDRYDAATRTYELTVTQSCPPTPGPADEAADAHAAHRRPARRRRDAICRCASRARTTAAGTSAVLSLRKETEVFRFVDVPALPVPSLGRDFSAPVIIDYAYSDEALLHLLSLRQRSVQPLGSRTAAGHEPAAQGRGRPSRRPAGAVPRIISPRPSAGCWPTPRRIPPSPPRRSRCRPKS